MGKRIEYKLGEKVGPYGCVFVREEKPKIKPNGKPIRQALFLCPRCRRKAFITRIELVRSGKTRSCGCYNRALITEHHKKDLTGQKFGLLTAVKTVGQDKNKHFIWLCECDCGNKEVYALAHKLLGGNKISCGCIHSKGEQKVKGILQQLKVNFIQQKTFKNCINPKTKQPLKFDFYLPDYNYCIEYDGEQHYFYKGTGWNNKENFEKTQYRDGLKTQYCKDYNINLVRISYTDFDKIDENYIKEKIGI